MENKILEEDFKYVVENTDIWSELKNSSIFLTGGTGFFGTWFLKTFLYANRVLSLNSSICVLSRNPEAFLQKHRELDVKEIAFIKGDIKTFEFIEEKFSYIIHASTTNAQETFDKIDPLESFETIVNGTKRVLDFALHCGAKKILLTSSGSIYGKSSANGKLFEEEEFSNFNSLDLNSTISQAKAISEFYASYYAKKYALEIKIARCFAFVGPFLQLDIHYAVGNFIKGAIEEKKIVINGDGTPVRSYMYVSDLMVWLWSILIKGESCRPYNVGSQNTLSMRELANIVGECFDEEIKIEVLGEKNVSTNSAQNIYAPSTKRAQKELGLQERITLKDALKKTINFIQREPQCL